MLIETKGNCEIKEIGIQTIYDLRENQTTHFDSIKDSLSIYIKYLVSYFKRKI